MSRSLGWLTPILVLVAGCDAFFDLTGLPRPAGPGPNANANTGPVDTGEVGLKRFESAAEFQQYFSSQVSVDDRYGFRGEVLAVEDVQFDAAPAPEGDAGAVATGPDAPAVESDDGASLAEDFSTTTTQEEGVQEADIIKNDGKYLYVLANSTLRIVQADPGELLQELSRVILDGFGQDLYLLDDKVVALTRPSWSLDEPAPLVAQELIAPPSFFRPRVLVTVIDVADHAAPVIESTTWFEGDLSSSRMIGRVLHLVVVNYPDFFRPVLESGDRPVVADMDVETLLPDFEVAVAGDDPVDGNTVDWPDFYYPVDPDGFGMTLVVSLNIDDPAAFDSVGVVAYPGLIYASTEALYLTDASLNFSGDLRQTTDIYKFSLTDDGPMLTGVGPVPGRILNQYSMSEHEGHLRVATTIDRRFSFQVPERPSTNNVFVLAEEGDELNVVGSIENIAENEEIRSARFSGTRGYLVTFERIDPLFTLDLSDPTNPQIVGELKIPGFSTFIIEMGDNHLLTIGQDALTDGPFVRPQGVQLSIFDISNFAEPERVFSERIGEPDAWSEALHNPKALTYFAAQDLLAVPVEIFGQGFGFEDDVVLVGEPDEFQPENEPADEVLPPPDDFRGLFIYQVTPENGFVYLGRMSTSMGQESFYYSTFTRGVFMNGNVFGVTDLGVVGAPVTAVEPPQWLVTFENALPDSFRE